MQVEVMGTSVLPFEQELERARHELLARLPVSAGGLDPRIVAAFASVPRERFVPERERFVAYADRALPIGEEQTISQPTMLAIMLKHLDCLPSHRVLEVGAGSGYAAALLAQLSREVFAIEIRPALAERAAQTLRGLGIDNATVLAGDGALGLREHAPFDRILVSAGADDVPPALLEQLAVNGRIAIPVGGQPGQTLRVGTRGPRGIEWQESVPCMFVPLVH